MKQSETKRSLCILTSLIFSSLILVPGLIFRSLFRRSLTTSPLLKVLSLVGEFNISLILMILDKRVRINGDNYSKLVFFIPSFKCPQDKMTLMQQSENVYHSGRDVVIRIVVVRDITHTTLTQMRGVHIRDKIIKGSILLGSP
jgi:hypothetical protein